MFGICIPEILDPETAPKQSVGQCRVSERSDDYGAEQMNGDWLSKFLGWLRDVVRQGTARPSFEWRYSYVQLTHKILEQVPDPQLRGRIIHFVNETYESWKGKHVTIPNEVSIVAFARNQACGSCTQRVLTDHTGRTQSLCNVDCHHVSAFRASAAREMYRCNVDVLYRLYAEFCLKHGYTTILPPPASEFMQLNTDPPFEQTLTPLVSLRQLIKETRKQPA